MFYQISVADHGDYTYSFLKINNEHIVVNL